jgi:hypothetical protein
MSRSNSTLSCVDVQFVLFSAYVLALLCAVCVWLHLVLFPAGGTFLPSLSVKKILAPMCGLAQPLAAVWSRPVLRPVCGFLDRLRFELCNLASCRVWGCTYFFSGWRAFSSVALCKDKLALGQHLGHPRCNCSH